MWPWTPKVARQTTLAESGARAIRVRADAQAHAEHPEAQGQADANQALALDKIA